MYARNLENDLSILESYFTKTEKAEVQLLSFDNSVTEKNFTVLAGEWHLLREELEGLAYDGATIFSNLKGKIKFKEVFIFTDGNRLAESDVIILPPKSFIVNSSVNSDDKFLERTALINRSKLIDFTQTLSDIGNNNETSQLDKKTNGHLKGTVFIDNKPASNTLVTVKGRPESFITDASGIFTVNAEVGDSLIITNRDNKTMKTVSVDFLSHIKVLEVSS
jgi:hypothetical protein